MRMRCFATQNSVGRVTKRPGLLLYAPPPSTLNPCGMGDGFAWMIPSQSGNVLPVGQSKIILAGCIAIAALVWTEVYHKVLDSLQEVRKMVDWVWLVVAFFAGQWTLVIGAALLAWATYRKEWRKPQ